MNGYIRCFRFPRARWAGGGGGCEGGSNRQASTAASVFPFRTLSPPIDRQLSFTSSVHRGREREREDKDRTGQDRTGQDKYKTRQLQDKTRQPQDKIRQDKTRTTNKTKTERKAKTMVRTMTRNKARTRQMQEQDKDETRGGITLGAHLCCTACKLEGKHFWSSL
jgi:hypothetical protein